MDEELRLAIEECRWKSVQFLSETILKHDPDNFEALFGKAIQLFSISKYVALEEWMRTLPLSIASDLTLLNIRCRGLEKQKRFDEIVVLLGGDLENQLAPPLIPMSQVSISTPLSSMRERALFNLSHTNYRDLDFESIPSSDPLSPLSVHNDVVQALMSRDKQILQKYTTMCDRTSENDAAILTACGCHRYLCGRVDTAIALLAKATDEDPDLEIAWIALVEILTESCEHEQGLVTLKKAQRRFPNSEAMTVLAISLHLKMKLIELARPYIRSLRSDDLYAIHEMGVSFLIEGEAAEAANCFQKLMSMKLDSRMEGSTYMNLGHSLRLLDKYEAAMWLYQNAVKCDVKVADALTSIGFTYHLMYQLDDAITYYNKCLAVNPSHPFAAKMLHIALNSTCH